MMRAGRELRGGDMVGYHSPAGSPANPLSHTMTGRAFSIQINGARPPNS